MTVQDNVNTKSERVSVIEIEGGVTCVTAG